MYIMLIYIISKIKNHLEKNHLDCNILDCNILVISEIQFNI